MVHVQEKLEFGKMFDILFLFLGKNDLGSGSRIQNQESGIKNPDPNPQ